jgi:hypothetical protein
MTEQLNLRALQDRQAAYDQNHWTHEPGVETVEHCLSHLAKLLGKLGAYVELTQHGEVPDSTVLTEEVIPDLAIFSARMANLMETDGTRHDLGALVEAREQALRERFS